MIKHTWQYCDHCEHDVVICGACGNNTCNGGSGTVDGRRCEHCDNAYKMYLGKMNKVSAADKRYMATEEKTRRYEKG